MDIHKFDAISLVIMTVAFFNNRIFVDCDAIRMSRAFVAVSVDWIHHKVLDRKEKVDSQFGMNGRCVLPAKHLD